MMKVNLCLSQLLFTFCFSVVVAVALKIDQIDDSGNRTVYVSTNDFKTEFYVNYKTYLESGYRSDVLNNSIKLLYEEPNNIYVVDIPLATRPVLCLYCHAVYNLLIELYRETGNETYVKNVALELCRSTTHKTEPVCRGLINLLAPVAKYILDGNHELNVGTICDISFQGPGCTLNTEYTGFVVDLSKKIETSKVSSSPIMRSDHTSDRPYIIVHISDLHYDQFYSAGSNAACDQPICCRAHQGIPTSPKNQAGKWGEYRACNSPWIAVEDMIKQVKMHYKTIDLIYFTGDIVDHFIWERKREYNAFAIKRVFNLLRKEFEGIPVLPVLGNHDPSPGNLFPPANSDIPDEISNKWLYDLVIDEWRTWLPNDTDATIQSQGYYTVLLKTNWRIIGLSSAVCLWQNIWLYYNTTAFVGQLQWLHDTLQYAEDHNELVHILSHVPTSSGSCFVGWTREFRKIIEKFAHIIRGQFNGHSHSDEFVLFYAKRDPSKLVNVAWNGGSGTTLSNVNPNFKVYQVDAKSYEVLNFKTWIYNLTEANLYPNIGPRWILEYSFREEFGLQDLSLNSLDKLLKRLVADKELLTTFWSYKHKQGDPYMLKGCDDKCLLETLCSMVSVEFRDSTKCDEIKKLFK